MADQNLGLRLAIVTRRKIDLSQAESRLSPIDLLSEEDPLSAALFKLY